MCLIILNTKGTIQESEFKEAWRANPHGGGLAWVADGRVKAWRTLKNASALHNKYLGLKETNPESVFLIHFRFATHGSCGVENTHPFKVHNGLYFAHNGIMSKYGSSGLGKDSVSDTRDFNAKILQRLPGDFTYDDNICKMLEDHVGTYNKLVFIDSDNNFRILNEKQGHWCHRKENWYSNYSYRKYTAPLVPTTYTASNVSKGKKSSKVHDIRSGAGASSMVTKVITTGEEETKKLYRHLTKAEFEKSSTFDKETNEFFSRIKYPKWADTYIGKVSDKEITFATIDCGLEPYIDIQNKLVWAIKGTDEEIEFEYSRNEIQNWMKDGNSTI